MEGLPFLPGNTFKDPTQQKYHVSQTLGYKNGYCTTKRPTLAVGGRSLHYNQLSAKELDHLANYNPTLTYGQARQAPPEDFIPAHVAWDKKVLKFDAYFKQTVHESPNEHYRVRHVVFYYYLEDDSIAVMEPQVDNSGMPQGPMIKRQRLPKNDRGDNWHWKDLNVGINVSFYGKVFRVISCDKFTSDFLESEGIIVNPPETAPADPYIENRRRVEALPTYKTKSAYDAKKQFLELDRRVLRFYAMWDERKHMFGENREFVIQYYLADDTLEVLEVRKPNNGRDPFPLLVRRQRVPRDRNAYPSSFPIVAMELTQEEVKEYITPKDLMVGKTVDIYARRFLIYDCDNFTKAFYYQHFGITDFRPVDVAEKVEEVPRMEIPPYNNYGTLEDSLQSCLSFTPKPPKRDVVKAMENNLKVLRFEAVLDSMKPEDAGRRFIISFRLADDMLTVYEPPVRNSGIMGGKFLQATQPCKPGSTPENPDYYGPQDFYKGAMVEIFGHRFIITNADAFVVEFMEKNAHQFPPATIQSLKETVSRPLTREDKERDKYVRVQRTPGDLQQLVGQVKAQLKKVAIIDKPRVDEMFLRYDRERSGYLSADNFRDICRRLQLPVDDDVLHALIRECTDDPQGRIGLEDFRRFLET
ncbi:EF-hand domain-containing protein 1-like [Babylonia areolata]|uniref:EF-hand domain-containing protein 1-like n=1 Tax=Babylonia areolata TaxID=304850 RepID=UPI003FD46E95